MTTASSFMSTFAMLMSSVATSVVTAVVFHCVLPCLVVGGGHLSTPWAGRENAAAVAVPKTRCALRSFLSVSKSYFQIGL